MIKFVSIRSSNCYSCRHHRSAMAEILHIQLKIPLHESKREGEEDARARAQERERPSVAAAHLYIYTHHQLTICTYVCRHHCRRTKTNSRPVTLPLSLSRARALFILPSFRTTVASSQYFSSPASYFSPPDTRDVVLQMTLIRKRESAYKKSVITRLELDEDASSCHGASERAASYYRSRVAAATATRK